AITVAEGDKQSAVLRAEGQKQSAILEAEGQRQSQLLKAQGYAKALEAIYNDAKNIDDKTMLLQYLDTLRTIGESESTKFVLPMEITNMMQQFASAFVRNDAMDTAQKQNGHAAPKRISEEGDV